MKSLEKFMAEMAAKEEVLEASGAKLGSAKPATSSQLEALGQRFSTKRVRSAPEENVVPKRQSNGFGRERTAEELATVTFPEFKGEPKGRVWASGHGKPKSKKAKDKK